VTAAPVPNEQLRATVATQFSQIATRGPCYIRAAGTQVTQP
jgi:hypothetical protein